MRYERIKKGDDEGVGDKEGEKAGKEKGREREVGEEEKEEGNISLGSSEIEYDPFWSLVTGESS